MIDLDRVTAQALTELGRTDVGISLFGWMHALVEGRKERLVSHRGIASIPDMWHDQGFIAGVRAVGQLFDHAELLVQNEDDTATVDIPDPDYLGASPVNPRR